MSRWAFPAPWQAQFGMGAAHPVDKQDDLGSRVVEIGHADGFGIEIRSRDTHHLAPPLDQEVGGPTVADVGALLGEGLER